MNEILLTNGRRKSRIRREINAVITIALRDITLALRSPSTIIMSLAMPLIMMGMLGRQSFREYDGRPPFRL